MQGFLVLHLHAHLPYVRHPEHESFLEEDWLFEAITETYLPILSRLEVLADEGIPFRLSMTLSPPLVQMLRDDLLRARYDRHIDKLCALAEREVARTHDQPAFHKTARFYRDHFFHSRWLWHERYRRDLVAAFRALQDRGHLEIVTCGATHGFLPLVESRPEMVRAQIGVAAAHYRLHFGRDPVGIWLPECGYYPGLDRYLAEENIRYFFVDTHGITDASPRTRFGVHAPIFTPSGVAAFGRDPESSEQVWSAELGYPGDPAYRDFYRDIGFDLDEDYVRPYVQPTGDRKSTGFKYHRITGKTDAKEPWDWEEAFAKAGLHAANFVFNRERQFEHLESLIPGRPPLVVAPYDAELFGHWWFEGPVFLEQVIRRAAEQSRFKLGTCSDYLRAEPTNQMATPPMSSWGAGGYAGVWLDGSNDWIYRHLLYMGKRMATLAQEDADAPRQVRARNQAARELLLAQSSDWAFIMKTGTMVEYAIQRTREHVSNFLRLDEEIQRDAIDEEWLGWLEYRNNLFPELDYRIYRPTPGAP